MFNIFNICVLTPLAPHIVGILTVIAASAAAYFAYKTFDFERKPVVHAVGTFIISTKPETNDARDEEMERKDSFHTFQVVNVGRGPAQDIVLSLGQKPEGKFLEDKNPHSFSLPANKGTNELIGVLAVYGQHEIFSKKNDANFYISFQDFKGKNYLTEVKIRRVDQADGRLKEIIETKGLQVWKVMANNNKP